MKDFRVIDMHCDTIPELLRSGKPFAENDLHVSLKKLEEGRYMAQCFAMFVYLEGDLHPFATVNRYIDKYDEVMAENPGRIRKATTAEEIEENARQGIISAILTTEEGGILEGQLDMGGAVADFIQELPVIAGSGAEDPAVIHQKIGIIAAAEDPPDLSGIKVRVFCFELEHLVLMVVVVAATQLPELVVAPAVPFSLVVPCVHEAAARGNQGLRFSGGAGAGQEQQDGQQSGDQTMELIHRRASLLYPVFAGNYSITGP
ncbi:MAG: membrane dipeptidase, partial [Erysipelotrichaceae bacterium]|nr:membrane dipeptidase [Erysipelotrichaceae bacterium]